MDFTQDTPRKTVKIAGIDGLQIYQPFVEGHQCTGNEAGALNQTAVENIRNNFANRAKAMKDEAEKNGTEVDLASAQLALDGYMEAYDIGVRRGRGTVLDPVERETINLATKAVKVQLKSSGVTLSELDPTELETYVTSAIERFPQFREKAQRIVDEQTDISGFSLE